MEFNVTREQWIDRFVLRLSTLQAGAQPATYLDTAEKLWPTRGQLAPEAAAEAEAALRRRRRRSPASASTTPSGSSAPSASRSSGCRRPRSTCATTTSGSPAASPACSSSTRSSRPTKRGARSPTSPRLERWRLMKPEAAAEQLYTPIKLRAE